MQARKKPSLLVSLVGAVALSAMAAPFAAAQTGPRHSQTTPMRPGQMQPGHGGAGMMGPEMMRQMMRGMMQSMMSRMMGVPGMRMGMMLGRRVTDRKLDALEVERILSGMLAWHGNKRLKIGKVEEKDDNTVTAEIQTVDNSLVTKLAVNRKTGAISHAE